MLPAIYMRDYAYNLPATRIARYPAQPRDTSRLLVYNGGNITSDRFCNITAHLPPHNMLIFNDTKVIPARLIFRNNNDTAIEIFCVDPCEPISYEQSLRSTHSCIWTCLVGNQKRWKSEELRQEFVHNGIVNELIISRIKSVDTYVQIEFRWNAEDCTFAQVLAHCGTMPLPPYLRRCAEHSDYEHYQTIYAQHEGSVAAPTSGLHFTEQVMNSLAFNNIATEKITLHVGAGTFLPVKTSTANDHIMHQERFNVRRPLLEKLQTYNDKIIAVGTTSARTLESLYWIGANLLLHKTFTPHLEQWQAYKMDDSVHRNDALNALYKYMIMNNLDHIECSTSLMIMPPYCYKIVNGLITNFHQPQSTLLLLVSAMVGAEWRRIYDYAMNHDFRFLSYGDSSLIFNIEQK